MQRGYRGATGKLMTYRLSDMWAKILSILGGSSKTKVAPNSPEEVSLRDEIAGACVATGLMFPEAATWIAAIAEGGSSDRDESMERAVRNAGEPANAQIKKSLGVRGNAKLGTLYIAALTEKGRKEPLAAAFLVVHRAMTTRRSREEVARYSTMPEILEGV